MANRDNRDNQWRGQIVNLTDVYGRDGWEPATLEAGFRYGAWEQAPDGEYIVPDYLSGSDYSGSLVERSNRDVWRETFAEGEDQWWCEVLGGHGTFAIVVRIADMPDDAREFLDALEDYPLADEDAHSRLEMEAQDEAWENWARHEFETEIEQKFDGEFSSEMDREALFELFRKACDESNTYWENESGDSMYIDMDRVVTAVRAEDLEGLSFEVNAYDDDEPTDEAIGPMYLPDRQIFLPFDA